MGISTRVVGFVPPDEKFKQMKEIFDACDKAGINPPDEVWKFFNYDRPCDAGVEVDIENYVEKVWPWRQTDGFQIDLERLAKEMPHVKTVLFYNSY